MRICVSCGAGMYFYLGYFVCPVCGSLEREVRYA